MGIVETFCKWWKRRKERKEHEATLAKFGWDVKCPKCDNWLHRTGAQFLRQTGDHWFFRCAKCGQESRWLLNAAPVPLLDIPKEEEEKKEGKGRGSSEEG